MKKIKLKTFREECGGCPTHYTGETVNGEYFDAYLRHGFMKVTLDDKTLVSTNPRGLDGVCSFSDFVEEVRKRGYVIDNKDATFSSSIEDTEKLMQELYKDVVWVKFTRDFTSQSTEKTYKEGKNYTARIELAEQLVELGLATIDDVTYERKKEAYQQEKSNQ